MRRITLLLSVMLACYGCTTTAGQQAGQALAPDAGPGLIQALQDFKAALQPILATVAQDATATRAWAVKVVGPSGTNPDPVKFALANACPTATDAVGGLINGTLDQMIATVGNITSPPDPSAPQGYLILFLTQLKYGPQPDPKAQLAALNAQINLQLDALFTGCGHLFPKKQLNDLVKLAAKAGITGFSGGALAPLMGALP